MYKYAEFLHIVAEQVKEGKRKKEVGSHKHIEEIKRSNKIAFKMFSSKMITSHILT